MASSPSSETVRGPFERVQTPDEAVDRLTQLYDEATQALRAAVERFLKEGEPPSAATRSLFRYPELRLTYKPNGAGAAQCAGLREVQRTRRLHDDGHAAAGVPRLSARAARAARLGIRRTDRGRRRRPGNSLPLCDRERRRADARRRGRGGLARYFPSPSLATIGDETADGEFVHGDERPLALFDAPRVDYSLRRLVHYTGSDWRAMQPWVLLTNYHRYVDQFFQWGLKQLHSGEGVEKVILPGNVVIDRSLSVEAEARAAAVAWHRFQMPAYHIVRSDGRGVSLGQHRRGTLERQEHHRSHRGAETSLLADGRPLRGPAPSRR